MKVEVTQVVPEPQFAPVTLTFVCENAGELELFQALAEQVSSGPIALAEKAQALNKMYPGYTVLPYTPVSDALVRLRETLRAANLYPKDKRDGIGRG